MQRGKGAISSVMEAAANVAASAKSGLDKTKAVLEEKKERMSTSDVIEKDMATLRKEEKIDLAELRKCKAYAQNAIAAAAPIIPCFTDGGEFNTIGSFNQPAAAATNNAGGKNVVEYSRVAPAATFAVEDVVRPAPEQGQGQVVSADNASHTNSSGKANVGGTEVADTNPTHTGMPAPVVEPDGVDTGFKTEINTGSGTHFSMK